VNDGKLAGSRQRHVVVLCHPSTNSLNAEIARVYASTVRSLGHDAEIRDLYRMNFDAILKNNERPHKAGFGLAADVQAELAVLENADTVVLVYPIWFGTPPAMLKGYIERVFGAGVHYESIDGPGVQSPMRSKHLLSISTSGKTAQWLDERGAWLSLLTVFDRYLVEMFSMKSSDHLRLSDIFVAMQQRHVDEELFKVRDKATATVARLAPAGRAWAAAMA